MKTKSDPFLDCLDRFMYLNSIHNPNHIVKGASGDKYDQFAFTHGILTCVAMYKDGTFYGTYTPSRNVQFLFDMYAT